MGYEKYKCDYEILVGISLLEHYSREQKKEIAEQSISYNELEKKLGPVLCRKWNAELEWEEDKDDGLNKGHIFFGTEDYPKSLIEDNYAPFSLSWKGCKPVGCNGNAFNAQSLTVVGTRNSNQEGRRGAYLFSVKHFL